MMIRFIAILLVFIVNGEPVRAQTVKGKRYQADIFDKVYVTKNGSYAEAGVENMGSSTNKFDLYEPANDTAQLRPLIIWMHGGGFKLGKKTSRGIPGWCRQFAKKGYVSAAISYSKSKKKPLSNFPDLVEGCYDAAQDLQQAVRYFKQNSTALRLDSNRIFLAGNSAGAMIALQAAYSNPKALSALFDTTEKASTDTQVFIPRVAGVISFWGCLFDTTWLQHAKVPIAMVHGKKDNVVAYTKGETPMYGSYLIQQQAMALHIPNALKTYDNYGHELQKLFIPFLAFPAAHRRWKEAGEFAADFFYTEYFQ